MRKKLTIGYIRKQFEKEEYKLLSKKYVNAHSKLDYRCPNGHYHSIEWNKWQQGYRCYYCGIIKNADRNRSDIDHIKSSFISEGYVLLTLDYINNKQKLDYLCCNGHKNSIRWNDWQRGLRCPHCAGNAVLDLCDIRRKFANEGYELLANIYYNSKQKLEYKCSNNHIHRISWSEWRRGNRCPFCYYIRETGSGNGNWKNYSKADLEKLTLYRKRVWQLTNHNYRKYRLKVNPMDLLRKRHEYSIDHIYSIANGFINNIPPEIIASPANLRMLSYRDNITKRDKSDILLEELYNRFEKWGNTDGI